MKRKLTTIAMLGCIALLAGCSIFTKAVPTTKVKWQLGGQTGSFESPKNTVCTNVNVSVTTNGTATLTIGYMSSVNDSNVIGAAYAGQASMVDSVARGMNQAFEAGLKAAGTVGGAAIKAP